jgi:hypothetical protein
LVPTVGPAHDGVEFLAGSLPAFGNYAVGMMSKSHHGKFYIDDPYWGLDTDSIEYGYRVPFGKIHTFIGMVGEPAAGLENIAGIESARHAGQL